MSIGTFAVIRRDGFLAGKFIDADLTTIRPKMPSGHTYRVGIDQSTSCTGLYITDQDCTFHFIGHMSPGGSERQRFYKEMLQFLYHILIQNPVDLFVMEDIIAYNSGKRNSQLTALKKEIMGWRKQIPTLSALATDRFSTIPISTWKSHMVNKKKGKGRTRSKQLMATDMVEKYPELIHYYKMVDSSSDYDGFDAFGILQGFLLERNIQGSSDNYIERIGGAKDYKGDIMVFYKLMSLEELANLTDYLSGFEAFVEAYGSNFYQTNQNISWYDNVKKAATSREFTLTAVESPKHRIMLQWLLGFPKSNKNLMCFILRKSVIPSKSLEFMKNSFMYEEVTW